MSLWVLRERERRKRGIGGVYGGCHGNLMDINRLTIWTAIQRNLVSFNEVNTILLIW
jgi:hypothetical protein